MREGLIYLVVVTVFCFDFSSGKVPMREFQAVAGEEARLPCNIAIPKEPEIISLILWYRETSKSPIYTLDFRKGLPDDPKHFPGKTLTGRAHFDTAEYPPTLKIKPTHVDDEGVYKCRLEYKRSRIVTRFLKLIVIVPPQAVVIMDDKGQKLKRLAGPYDEGSRLSLLCEAEGGNPAPLVTWWKNGNMIDDTYFRTSKGFVRNELELEAFRRSDFMVELSCQASNTNLTDPLSASIRIDLNMKPLYVRITTPPKPLKAGDDLRLDCETSGSRPAAKLLWLVENKLIQNSKQSFFTNRNITYGSINLSPKNEDNGKTVTCRAENPSLNHTEMQDTWTLNMHFPPEVSLQLGANIKYSTIKEGNDVYLECVIKANPPISELIWFFEGVPFYGNTSAGVIISNQSLVLQKVRKEHRGRYKCTASNTEGQGRSLELLLEVRYAPSCSTSLKALYGVTRGETVNITCEVDSDPDDVTFNWALNNSVENVELYNFTSKKTRSVLTYTPKAMLEFGAILCWGKNSVGEQKEPCVSRIIPAGPPDPVRNCVVANRSRTWLLIDCEAGYNGGLPQKFHLDVYNSEEDALETNITTSDLPLFLVTKLPPGTPFVLIISASNEKGRSNTVALLANTLSFKDSEAEASSMISTSSIVAVMLAAVGTLLVIGVVALALFQIRKKRRQKDTSIEEDDTIKLNMSSKKLPEDFTENSAACPDVVPPINVCENESFESANLREGQSPESAKCSKNYRNCVVALKRSWSLKKRGHEKAETEVSLDDLTYRDYKTVTLSPDTVAHPSPWLEEDMKQPNKSGVLILEKQDDDESIHQTIVSQKTTLF
ncbi:kin of IRRE-like protein 3 [Parasteatoda tepidariorum]|uniref:kin of IRRE-like protein 3 n=1 Tax=Parasteatoda tepidariorum TaxID=114398 RepID=UPI00077F8674|nr:hemicentin-2-like isoform X2 [Parasteatoda tepidariorum]